MIYGQNMMRSFNLTDFDTKQKAASDEAAFCFNSITFEQRLAQRHYCFLYESVP